MRKAWDHAIDLREGFVLKKGKIYPLYKSRKRGGTGVCKEPVEEGVYQAIEITTNVTSVLCAKERQKEKNSTRLSISEQLDDQKQLSVTTDFGFDRQHREEESIYKNGFAMGVQ